jgi:hypothetical protein
MAQAASSPTSSLETIEWMWKSNPDPFHKEQKAEWKHYSDVESLIIEEAFAAGRSEAIIDDYIINLETRMQTSRNDAYKQRPVKRFIRNRNEKRIRETRFMDLPVGPGKSSAGQYGWISPFIVEVRRKLNLGDQKLPSKNPELIPDLIKQAALGIIKEGTPIRKPEEAKKMAGMLLAKKDCSIKEVWQCCVYLYTMESFLYKTINATLRLIGSKEDEAVWKSKVSTLGPFCLLLWDDPFTTQVTVDKTLYRGANLSDSHIAEYQQMAGKEDQYRSFQSFVSTSRSRVNAENFGNTLFIMEVLYAFIADISQLSTYRSEEEELITPGVCFRVTSVESDKASNKHIIHLQLRQRFNSKFVMIEWIEAT